MNFFEVNEMRSLIFLVFIFSCATAQIFNYHNYKVYRVNPENEQQIELLRLLENNQNVDFWTDLFKFNHPVNIMVSPPFQSKFETVLNKHQINYKKIIEDVQTVIDNERLEQSKITTKNGEISFEKYHRYSEIQDYLKRLADENPKLVLLENYGKSYENRNLTSVRISSGGDDTKPVIFVDAGIHAREWIAPPQALYVIEQLLKNKHFTQNIDWVVIPLLNPDGYEYTHTTDRLWRKTRSIGKVCDGVDPNRNFDYHWMGPGTSTDECSNTYAGPSPFSEPETLALSKTITKYSHRTKLYLTFHSAAQSFLYPWGYTSELPENVDELDSLASEAEEAVSAINGTNYKIGSSFNTLSPASGSSRDWAYGAAGINLAYTMELPPGGGENRFDMPPERILGVVEEMFEAVKVFHKRIENKYVKL